MSRITKSVIKNHGPCETCGKDIEKGQSMRRTLRHATKEERENTDVRTYSVIPGQGPQMGVKIHAECPHPESKEGRRIREERMAK